MPTTENQSPGSGNCGSPDGGGSKLGETFVQADATCFRDLVQRLTGLSRNETDLSAVQPPKKTGLKLHERRKYARPSIEITKPTSCKYPPPFSSPVYSTVMNFQAAEAASSPWGIKAVSPIISNSNTMVFYSTHANVRSNKRMSPSSAVEIISPGKLVSINISEGRRFSQQINMMSSTLNLSAVRSLRRQRG